MSAQPNLRPSFTQPPASGTASTAGSTSGPQGQGHHAVTRAKSKSTVHLPLYRRILFPTDDRAGVPQLVVGQGKEVEEINERLHHLIALALRAYVLSWYRFTSSRTLPSQIHGSIVRPTLQPILSGVYDDPERLCAWIVLDLPTVLGLHWRVYREAKEASDLPLPLDEVDYPPGDGRRRRIGVNYHARLPLLSTTMTGDSYALSPLYLSTLSTAILKHADPDPGHPRTDGALSGSGSRAAPDVERLMAREILARSILGTVGRRAGEAWFWYMLVLKLLGEPEPEPKTDPAGSDSDLGSRPPSSKKSPAVHEAGRGSEGRDDGSALDVLLSWTARLYTALVLMWTSLASLVALYSAAPAAKYERSWEPAFLFVAQVVRSASASDGAGERGRGLWTARLVCGVVEMLLSVFGSVVDRLFPHLVRTHLTPTTSLKIIDLIQRLLFPLDGWPGPSPVDPTPEEEADMRRRAERRLGEVIPRPIKVLFFPTPAHIGALLDPLSNAGCNAHLLGMTLDSLVAALIPDLVVDADANMALERTDPGSGSGSVSDLTRESSSSAGGGDMAHQS